jgi:hypothetical protein
VRNVVKTSRRIGVLDGLGWGDNSGWKEVVENSVDGLIG